MRERGQVHRILSRFGAIDVEGGARWNDLELVLGVANIYAHRDDDAKVERYFVRCGELNPRRAAIYHCQIGWYFQRKKRWARGLHWYDRALETFPGYHLCLFRKGYCLERLHRPREAAAALGLAADSYEKSSPEQRERSRGIEIQVLFHLARNLREIGEVAAAREALDRCGVLDDRPVDRVIKPEHRLASYGETYLREGDAARAIEYLEAARERDPRSAVVSERLGRAYELAGDLERAEAEYRSAVELPKGAIALISLAAFLIRKERFREALEALAAALERHPQGEVQIRIEIADLQRRLGRAAPALDELLRLLAGRVPPRSTLAASIDARIADILVEHDHLTRALPHLAAALEQFQEDRDLRGKYEEAERRLRDGPPEERRPLAHAEVPAELSALLDLEPKRERGAIDSYYGDRRFGFIRDDRGVTVFFHASNVQLAPDQEIAVGARVSFVRGINHKNKKSQAEQVRLEIWFPGAGGDPGDPA